MWSRLSDTALKTIITGKKHPASPNKSSLDLPLSSWAGPQAPAHGRLTHPCCNWKDPLPLTWLLRTWVSAKGVEPLSSRFLLLGPPPLQSTEFQSGALCFCFKSPLVQFGSKDSEPLKSGYVWILALIHNSWVTLEEHWPLCLPLLTWTGKIKSLWWWFGGVTEKLYIRGNYLIVWLARDCPLTLTL